jgi:probable DNA metabolism protein
MDRELFTIPKNIEKPADLNEYAVLHEIHRMRGLLRFSPNIDGEFIARCSPDHNILSALADYFTARFGETAWSIIDEKRGLRLRRLPGERAKLHALENPPAPNSDEWEELWKHYHKTINNEDRFNPNLQRKLMPKRYWKYLPEA